MTDCHAACPPGKGALQTGFSLVTTATPISFGHDEFDPVSVVIAIAGADADSHIKMIQLIASLIESDIVTFLQQENDVNSVLHFIQNKWSSHYVSYQNGLW